METISNAQGVGEALDPNELRERFVSEAIDALYEGMLAVARFGRRQPLLVAGLGAAAALGFVALKPAARKTIMDSASSFVDSLRRAGSEAGNRTLGRVNRRRARTRRAHARATRSTRNGRQAPAARAS